MMRACDRCPARYNDAERSTICPHDRLLTAEDQARKDLAFTLIGKALCFQHETSVPERRVLRVRCIAWNGMVEVTGYSGLFAPFLFRPIGPAE